MAKIFNINLSFRSHWATSPDGIKKEIQVKGVIVLYLDILNKDGSIITTPVDMFYGLREEGEGILSYKNLNKALAAMKYKFLGTKVSRNQIYNINGGTGWRLQPEITKAIREKIFGAPEVPVSPDYLKKLEEAYNRRPTPESKYLELRDNPQLPPDRFWRKIWRWIIEGEDLVLPR